MRVRNHKIEDRMLLKKAARESCRQSLAIIYRKYRPMVYNYLKKAGADVGGILPFSKQDAFGKQFRYLKNLVHVIRQRNFRVRESATELISLIRSSLSSVVFFSSFIKHNSAKDAVKQYIAKTTRNQKNQMPQNAQKCRKIYFKGAKVISKEGN